MLTFIYERLLYNLLLNNANIFEDAMIIVGDNAVN